MSLCKVLDEEEKKIQSLSIRASSITGKVVCGLSTFPAILENAVVCGLIILFAILLFIFINFQNKF